MTERAYAGMVRRDVRTFVIAGILLVAALACLALWALDIVAANNGRVATLGFGLLAFLASFIGWASGDRRIPERLFVLAPVFLAAAPLAGAAGSFAGAGVGLAVSIALALGAAAAYGITRRG